MLNTTSRTIEILGFLFVFVVVIIGVFLSRTNLFFYESIWVGEDGFIEYTSAFALLFVAFLSISRAKSFRDVKTSSFVKTQYLIAFIFFFGFAEEISWGQRIIQSFSDFQVPDFFIKYNTQQEMTLHNLKFGETKINKLVFGLILGISIMLYFFVLPIFYNKIKKVKKKVDSLGIPIPKALHIISYFFLIILCEFIDGGKKGEMLEFGGSFITLLMFLYPKNKLILS